jgi:peptidoglycan/LPS O-acetylase OafA/YrhL
MTNGPESRTQELDGLRDIAVLMVLAWHFIGIPAWLTPGDSYQKMFKVLINGGLGVELFFVLSGFLITSIALKFRSSGSNFLLVFYLRRALRIFPLYFLLASFFWALVYLGVDNKIFNPSIPLWHIATFTQNFWMAANQTYGPQAIGVTWTVAIEEQYYWVLPLLAIFFVKRLPLVLIVLAILSTLFRVYLCIEDPIANAYATRVNTLARLDGLAMGGLIAIMKETNFWGLLEVKKKWALVLTALLSPGLYFVNRLSVTNMAFFGYTYTSLFFSATLILVLLNLGSSSFPLRCLPFNNNCHGLEH